MFQYNKSPRTTIVTGKIDGDAKKKNTVDLLFAPCEAVNYRFTIVTARQKIFVGLL
jgi:hypothetical protein